MPQIILSTTFRDFDKSMNDRMQMRFLHSLKSQTFQDFILVVTVFDEKKRSEEHTSELQSHLT